MGIFDLELSPQQRVTRAKYSLVKDPRFEFYGHAAFAAETVFTTEIPADGATDGLKIFIHPERIKEIDDENLKFLLCHEMEHICSEHLTRFKLLFKDSKSRDRMNIACDDGINKRLTGAGFPKYEQFVWLDDKFNKKSEEWIYANLPQEEVDKYAPQSADCLYVEFGEGEDGEEQSEEKKKLIENLVKIAKSVKGRSLLPSSISELIDLEGSKSNISWADYLRLALVPLYARRKSWKNPNKKFIHQGLYLPGKFKEGTDKLFVFVDTSGSMGIEELKQIRSEYVQIKDEFKPSELHILYFHTSVWRHDVIPYYEEIPEITEVKWGGTCFSAPIKYIEDKNLNPKVAIFMTDGFCVSPAKPPYDIIWCSSNHFPADYGTQIKLEFKYD